MPRLPITTKRAVAVISPELLLPELTTAAALRRRSTRLLSSRLATARMAAAQSEKGDTTAEVASISQIAKAEVSERTKSTAEGFLNKKRKAEGASVSNTFEEPEGASLPKSVRVNILRKRAPGFALRCEDADDTTATRRARLRKIMMAGDIPSEILPSLLAQDVARLCKELGNEKLGLLAPWEQSEGNVGGMCFWTGCHVSTAGGIEKAVVNAASMGCRAFAMDTRCKMRWQSPPLTDSTIAAFKQACKSFGYSPEQILPHGSYLINLASPDPEMANKGFNGFLEELRRCESLGLIQYNFHPGSTTGLCTHEESMNRIADFINRAHQLTKGVTVVLENMSSVGNIVGGRLWHLKYIIDRVQDKSRIGFCIDTCHLFSSGIDLTTPTDCEKAFHLVDEVVGLQYLKGMHLNDSKTPLGSSRDRHENLGHGTIPISTFEWIMNNAAFQGIPLIMETPVQEKEPPVNYKKSLELGQVVWKDPTGPYGVGTDRKSIMLLNSLCAK